MFLELHMSDCLQVPVRTVIISVALMGRMPRLLGQFSSWMDDTGCVEEERRGNIPSQPDLPRRCGLMSEEGHPPILIKQETRVSRTEDIITLPLGG